MPRQPSKETVEQYAFLRFDLDLDRRHVPQTLWVLLGEARSKIDHIAGAPLEPEVARRLHGLYLAKGIQATTAIEGNTLTEEQVRQRIEGQLELPISKEYLGVEIDNILTACNRIVAEMNQPEAVTPERICELNRMVLEGLPLNPDVVPGVYRRHRVTVGPYRAPPAQDVPSLVERMCDWLASALQTPDREMSMVAAIIRAIMAHLYLEWIHPFADGNGRTGRLLEHHILIHAGAPTPVGHLLSNHYNETRSEYYRQLDLARHEPMPWRFLEYAVQGLVDQLRQQVGYIREQQVRVAWANYVHEQFQQRTSPSDIRQRHLVLDLSTKREPLTKQQLVALTPRLAAAYANKTLKALSRDLNRLMEMSLVERTDDGKYRARVEIIRAFLPRKI